MTTSESSRQLSQRLSRRGVLRLLAGSGAAVFLASCGGTSPPTTAAPTTAAQAPLATTTQTGTSPAATRVAPASAPTATTSASSRAAAGTLRITDSGARLPNGNVSFRMLTSGGAKDTFFKAYFPAYQQAHPNIAMEYQALPSAELRQVVPLGIQNGNAPDVFNLPPGISAAAAVREGWVAPLDDVIPDFARWKAAFPPGTFFEGVTVFGGKTYSFPANGAGADYDTLLFYNTTMMQQAGYDPAKKALTWDEFRAAAQKITEQGKGQYYGFILGGKEARIWATTVTNLARMAGAAGSDNIDWKTGRYLYTSDQYLAAIDLLLALKADGSVFPGSLSLNLSEARDRMPQGAAGTILQGPWNIAIIRQNYPDFKFDVSSQPLPNTGTVVPLTYGAPPGEFWVYGKSQQQAVAGDVLHYLGTEEGQAAFLKLAGAPRPSVFRSVNANPNVVEDERTRRMFALFEEQVRLGPILSVRNPEVEQALLELKAVKPDLGEVVQGLYTGQIKEPKAAMRDLADRSEKELERAIKAAADKGAKVSRDDWKFPNWDPTKDYTADDYAALKR